MSADNGIYILETKETVGPRYRVAQCQASEDIHYCSEKQQFVNLPALWHRFKGSRVLFSSAAADEAARKELSQLTVCEYGINHITLDRPFPEFNEVLAFAIQEVDDYLSHVSNADRCIVQALHLINEQFLRLDLAMLELKSHIGAGGGNAY